MLLIKSILVYTLYVLVNPAFVYSSILGNMRIVPFVKKMFDTKLKPNRGIS